MSDFLQCGRIGTLHQMSPVKLERLEDELRQYVRFKPVSLVLPCQYSEITGTAMTRIVEHLKGADYLHRLVVTLDGAQKEGFAKTKEFFSSLPQETVIIWNNSPDMESFYTRLRTEGLVDTAGGRGRSLWMAMGYILARHDSEVIAVHDTDILTYERLLLARLIYPLLHPGMEYEFAKGYYARVTNRLHGRAMRLFVAPLLKALRTTIGPLPYLEYLDSFRYPISGEFAIKAGLMRVNRVPASWGLEIGLLEEVYRNCGQRRICQVDLSIEYEHFHLDLSDKDQGSGLQKMCVDIACTLFHALCAEGIHFSEAAFRSLKVAYRLIALDMIRYYEDDAAINGLLFDRHSEEIMVEAFIRGLDTATSEFIKDPVAVHFIPSWSRASSSLPGITSELVDIVEG